MFFVDDNQAVKPNEIGSANYIEEVKRLNCIIWKKDCKLNLDVVVMRSANWENNTLNIQRTANVMLEPKEMDYDFKIFDNPQSMEDTINVKMTEGFTARICAGFACHGRNMQLMVNCKMMLSLVNIEDHGMHQINAEDLIRAYLNKLYGQPKKVASIK